jgi:[ribosomal protein S5]-alanine N-acetyltransferase
MSHKVLVGNTPTLETERLLLRPLSADEADSLHRISNETNVRLCLWDDEPISEATIKSLIAQSDRMFPKEKIGLFGVRMRGREDLLGFCGFVRLVGMEESELWYELTQKVWGRGIATEVAWACVRYAFEEVGMERVIAGADAPNSTSLRVIEKLGMKYVGNINPSALEEPYFALYREDFFAAMARGDVRVGRSWSGSPSGTPPRLPSAAAERKRYAHNE